MKKLLLASVAVGGLAFTAPAQAGDFLEFGGYFKGYGAFVSQDETAGTDVNGFDMLRDTELHLGGEVTLDNGLTVGAHGEFFIDGIDGSAVADESYAYFSGSWGRLNYGNEDGAAFLLQVAAPSADSNIDRITQYIQPFANTGNMGNLSTTRLQYKMNPATKMDKLTYLSPLMSGFQVGVSFSPDTDAASDRAGNGTDTGVAGSIGQTYEVSARYEGQFQNVGVIAGAGYTFGSEEGSSTTTDDRKTWNVGLDLDIGPFGIGAAYTDDNNALDGSASADTNNLVVGIDYTTGPFKLGASYFTRDNEGSTGIDYDRYTAGVIYEYGPGMTFRGSIQQLEVDNAGSTADASGTAVLLGTQVNF